MLASVGDEIGPRGAVPVTPFMATHRIVRPLGARYISHGLPLRWAICWSELGEERVGASGETCAAVLGGRRRGGGYKVAGAVEVAVGAAGEAEVGVVELTACGPKRCLESGVDVVCDCEPGFSLVVVAEEGGGAGERTRNCAL